MRAGWYSDNQVRDYPIVHGTVDDLPKSGIVDAGFVVSETPTTPVRLSFVSLDGGKVVMEFTYGGAPSPLVFVFDRDDRFRTIFAWSDEGISESLGSEAPDCTEYWSGFVVCGDLVELSSWLEIHGPWASVEFGDFFGGVVEPALIQNISGGFVTSLTVVNADRTRAATPADCDAQTWPFETGVDHVVRRCITGPIRVADGYNVAVTQNSAAVELVFNAGVGLGKGEPCAEVQAFPEEEKPDDSDYYSGGPSCHEVVRRINAVPGPQVTLDGRGGIQVLPDPENHRLVIDVSLSDLINCTSASEGSESQSQGG